MKLRHSIAFAGLAALFAHAVQSQTSPSTAVATNPIRIGTWNLEHFGARPGALTPRTPEQIRAIAEFIRAIGVDVLAVQEIRSSAAVESLVDALGPAWRYLLGTTGGFRDGTGGIALGFLWNDAVVELVQAEELLQLPSEVDTFPIFHRKPISTVFRARSGGLDFRAITVHLKASRKQKDIAKRVREVGALRNYLKQLLANEDEDRDVVVLGDFNHTYRAPAFHTFTEGGFLDYLKPKRGKPRTIVHFDEPIDHVAVLPGLRDELVTRHVTVHHEQADRDLKAWRATYSDHIPVTVDLHAEPDRDPDSTFAPAGQTQWLRAGGLAAASQKRGPAVTNATDVAGRGKSGSNFTTGSHVEITWTEPHRNHKMTTRGRLLSSLGDWVLIREDGSDEELAFPRERVIHIAAVRR